MAFSCVQIQLVLGHRATLRTKKTPQGFTHDWEVFIRGPERTNIQNFVERVVFYLHKDFQKPKRVVKEANSEGAYVVKESGYGCFSLPIEIYFKNKDEPRKVKFEYDLFLQSEGPPISHVRYEKMTFKNPSEEFRLKLIKGGGCGVTNGLETGTVLTLSSEVKVEEQQPPVVTIPANSYSSGAKKPPGGTDSSKKHKSSKEPKSEHFNELFGTPTKPEKVDAKKSSSSSGKSKDLPTTSSSMKSADWKRDRSETKKEPEYKKTKSSKEPEKRTKDDKKSSKSKKGERKPKEDKKAAPRAKELKEDMRKMFPDEHKKKEEKKSSKLKMDKMNDLFKEVVSKPAEIREKKVARPASASSSVKSASKPDEAKVIADSAKRPENKKSTTEKSRQVKQEVVKTKGPEVVKRKGPEVVERKGPEEKPVRKRADSSSCEEAPVKAAELPPPHFEMNKKEKKVVDSSEEDRRLPPKATKRKRSSSPTESKIPDLSVFTPQYLSQLVDLQQKIGNLNDKDTQRIVDVVKSSGAYQVSTTTFDFDLCALDTATIRRIQQCLT